VLELLVLELLVLLVLLVLPLSCGSGDDHSGRRWS
jgi:hypothetical protein